LISKKIVWCEPESWIALRSIRATSDIAEMATNPRRSADCDLEWGYAFELASKGSGTRICYGDTVLDKTLPVLAYGEVWQRGGFPCKSEQSGITCFNADRHGFSLSRAKQEVF
jgi:hypothetical protein